MNLIVNFLPYYADSSLGIMPHTVQFYTFDDPAPTYVINIFFLSKKIIFLNFQNKQ